MPKAPKRIRLTRATVTIFDEGDSDWLCVVRGTRTPEPPRRAAPPAKRQRRREGQA